jgi:hypothetical protein
MPLLRMKTTLASPEYAVQSGDIWECPDDKLAKQLIDDGNAEEYEAPDVETVSTFHGGLKEVHRAIDERRADVPAPPGSSTEREDKEVEMVIERRTADELAADAARATGPAGSKDPLPVKTSNQQAAEEVAAKVAAAKVTGEAEKQKAAKKPVPPSPSPRPANPAHIPPTPPTSHGKKA